MPQLTSAEGQLAASSYSNVDSIFQPLVWRSKRLPSRLVLAPINTGFTIHGRPSFHLLRFHRERSGPAIGIGMVGNVAVEESVRTNERTAVLRADCDIPRFAVLARTISRRGSLSGIQLASAPPTLSPSRTWRTSDRRAEKIRLRDIVSSHTDEQLHMHLASFVRSGSLANRAGYSVVQVHAAHGYLLSLMLHPATNKRRGPFSVNGQWFERFLAQMRDSLDSALLSIRLSTLTGLATEHEEIEWTRHIEHRAAQSGADILDLSAGFYTIDRQLIYPDQQWWGPVYSRWLKTLISDLPCLVVVAGRFADLRRLEEPLPENLLIAAGRALIADPEFGAKARDGQFGQINYCRLKNHCHYFSRGREALECGVNPRV